ncbi:hypothetical protein Clacol_001283 [Clathrus columnatus]|uniref:C2H2-type domain-containing protein n=1 Tax=Clathrus columnatus TaxID=1419009 RepID=A0AAV5A1B2_9AGAM|nr:hypothetical protein Clacol_001283 [Clathrus columnatus]
MFARLFSSSKRGAEGTNVDKLAEVNGTARFPSPSACTEPGSVANSNTNTLPDSPSRLRTPSPNQNGNAEVDAASLKELFESCPPKIVYSYLTSQIVNASHVELHALASFFSELQPPIRLHCVRCHKSFFEVDNDDRSCTMPHDDESAEVEPVRGGGHETRWDCCGRIVEGAGELGPPSGWCYEGKHTIDLKRARYRNDSSLSDDKLISCQKKKCFKHLQPKEEKQRPPPSRSGKPRSVIVPEDARSVRSTRSTRSLKEDAVIGIGKPVVVISTTSVSTAGKKRKRAVKNEEDEEDSEEEPIIKPKSKATRTRAKPKEKENNQTDNDDDAKSVRSVKSVKETPAPKRRRRKPVVE